MRIVKLEKTKLGVLVTYKTWFKTKKREAVRSDVTGSWVWADTDNFLIKTSAISWFAKTNLKQYTLNEEINKL